MRTPQGLKWGVACLRSQKNNLSASIIWGVSFIVWPLDVAKVAKVSRVNIFKQKIQNFQFLATNMKYTSNESWNCVEFKFMTKQYDLIVKNWKKVHFSHFCLKTRLTRCLRRLISQIFLQQNSKMAWPGVVKRFEVKSHQIWALYLQPVRNGGRLYPRGLQEPLPPHLLGLRVSPCLPKLEIP